MSKNPRSSTRNLMKKKRKIATKPNLQINVQTRKVLIQHYRAKYRVK